MTKCSPGGSVTAHISLGSNLGDRQATLAAAVAALDEHPASAVTAVSALYETAPVGPDQPRFLNAAARLDTALAPTDLLQVLLDTEQLFARKRIVRWGPRTLDLDLLLYGDTVVEAEALSVPHPRLTERRFVLVPLAEIAGTVRHPPTGETIAGLLATLPVEPGDVVPFARDWLPHSPANPTAIAGKA